MNLLGVCYMNLVSKCDFYIQHGFGTNMKWNALSLCLGIPGPTVASYVRATCICIPAVGFISHKWQAVSQGVKQCAFLPGTEKEVGHTIYCPNQINSENDMRGIINNYVRITGCDRDVCNYPTHKGSEAMKTLSTFPKMQTSTITGTLDNNFVTAHCINIKHALPLTRLAGRGLLNTWVITLCWAARHSFRLLSGQPPKFYFTISIQQSWF